MMGHNKGKLAANNHELLNLSGLGAVQIPVDEEEVPHCEVGLTGWQMADKRAIS
jgi:hypothetical protein